MALTWFGREKKKQWWNHVGKVKKKKKGTGFFCNVAHLPHYNPTAGPLPLQHLALCFSYAASARGRSRPLWPCRAGCPLLNHCSQVSVGGTALPSSGDSMFRRLLCFLGGIDLLSVMLGKRQVATVTSCSKVQGKSCSERLWKLHPWRCPKFNCTGSWEALSKLDLPGLRAESTIKTFFCRSYRKTSLLFTVCSWEKKCKHQDFLLRLSSCLYKDSYIPANLRRN